MFLCSRSLHVIPVVCFAVTVFCASSLQASDFHYRYHSLSHGSADISYLDSGASGRVSVGFNDVVFTGTSCTSSNEYQCLKSDPFSFAIPRDIESRLSILEAVNEYFWIFDDVRYVIRRGFFEGKSSYKLRMTLLGQEFDAYQIFSYEGSESGGDDELIGVYIWSTEKGLVAFSTYHGDVSYESGMKTSLFTDYWLIENCGFGASSACVR